jgi:hypothetical protein
MEKKPGEYRYIMNERMALVPVLHGPDRVVCCALLASQHHTPLLWGMALTSVELVQVLSVLHLALYASSMQVPFFALATSSHVLVCNSIN